MRDMNTERKSLRGRTYVPTPVFEQLFSKDTVVWKDGECTKVPLNFVNDPFVTALVKFFNSHYFSLEVRDASLIISYRRAFEFLFVVLGREGLKKVPPNIYALYLSNLLGERETESRTYRDYTCSRSPVRRLASVRVKNKKPRNLAHLWEINLTDEERAIIGEADKLAPSLRKPESKAQGDLIEVLDLDVNAEDLIKSLRSFCAFFVLEWKKVRDALFKKFPFQASKFVEFSNIHPAGGKLNHGFLGAPCRLDDPYSRGIDTCFEIAKKIDHPFLTERFVVEYLAVLTAKDCISEAAKTIWDFDACKSTSSKVDWLRKIPEQYGNASTGRLCVPQHGALKYLKPGGRSYPQLEKQWVGILAPPFPVRPLVGQSIAEQQCIAWIFASDRHQPSNLRWMTVGDLSVTDNSISTILDPHTIKRRASRTSGSAYDELGEEQSFIGVAEGGTYKRSQLIFKAIMAHREQLIEASRRGILTGEPLTGDETNLWFFSEIRAPTEVAAKAGYIGARYSKFWQKSTKNFEILLCAMEGSLSNQYVLDNCPDARIFLDVIKQAYLLNVGKGAQGVGIGINSVARLAVNVANGKIYSESFTPLSDDSRPAISNENQLLEMSRDAALQNHSVSTKANVYADKLPAYIAKSSNFGARVGDEMVRMAGNLGHVRLEKSAVRTIGELRKELGIETAREKEIDQINDLLDQVNLERFAIDELGLIEDKEGKTVIIRHPITIALIQARIVSLDRQLSVLEYSNEKRFLKAVARFMYLKMLLSEKFTPSEISEANELYGDVEFPMSDILV